MITVYNANNYAQQWFFDKAYAVLKSKGEGWLTEEEIKYGRFLSIDNYFAHMGDLVSIEPSFALIPSDEEPFVINANDRTISIPSAFVKCAGVVGDDMCEIVTFTVDRYFDYVDLATANICIQWEAQGKEGISHVNLIDLDSTPGKVRFGWPLTNQITEKPGIVKFAVRFFRKKDDKFVYLLNTLTNSFVIREGLNITNPKVTEENVYNVFKSFVENSNNPSYDIPAPVYFNDTVGKNLPNQEKLEMEEDTLTLEAQAVVADNGYIDYQWYFRQGATLDSIDGAYVQSIGWIEGVQYYKFENEQFIEIELQDEEEYKEQGILYTFEPYNTISIDPEKENGRFTVTEVFKEIPTPGKRVGSEHYYKKVDGAYKLVVEEKLPSDIQLYERYTTLTINPAKEVTAEDEDPKEITGLYWVTAKNYTGKSNVVVWDQLENKEIVLEDLNKTPETKSNYCCIPTPQTLTLKNSEEKFGDVFKSQTEKLSYALNSDSGNPDRTFEWLYKANANDDTPYETIDDVVGDVFKLDKDTTPGWYAVKATSDLNRGQTTLSNEKTPWRVLNDPQAPVIQRLEYSKWPETDFDPELYFGNAENWNVFYDKETGLEKDMDANFELGDMIRLRVVTDLDEYLNNDDNINLICDNLECSWYVIEPDQEARKLGLSDIDPNGILHEKGNEEDHYLRLDGKNMIDVRCVGNDKIYNYYCEITNTLSTKKATLNDKGYSALFSIQ